MLEYHPVSEEDRRQFYDNGYLIVRNALDSDTVGRLIEAGDRLIASDETLDRQTNDDLYDGFRNVVSHDDAFIPLVTHPTILPLVMQLFGSNLQLSTSHMIYSKPELPGTSPDKRAPGWHRDNGRTTLDLGHFQYPRMGLKCAFYLSDQSQPKSGVTMFLPGSNNLKERIEIPEGQPDPVGAIEPSLNPGDCVLFEYRTWHAGAPNFSPNTRKAVMVGYCYQWLRPMDYLVQPRELVEKLDDMQRFLIGERMEETETFKPTGYHNPINEWCEQHDIETDRHGH